MTSSSETRATFRFVGLAVDPDLIGEYLGLDPDKAHEAGAAVPRHPGRVYPTGVWCLDSVCPLPSPVEDHIRSLLDRLEGSYDRVRELGATDDVRCSMMVSVNLDEDDEGYIALASDVLIELGRLGITLELHCYGSSWAE